MVSFFFQFCAYVNVSIIIDYEKAVLGNLEHD